MGKDRQELFNVIDMIAAENIRKTPFTNTINGKISERIKITDSYKVKYQNIDIIATSLGAAYAVGDEVVILVPSGNLSEEKFILGRTNNRVPSMIFDSEGISDSTLQMLQDINEKIKELASDNVLKPSEKQALSFQWEQIKNSYNEALELSKPYEDELETEKTKEKYKALDDIFKDIFKDMDASSVIDGEELTRKLEEYLKEDKDLRVGISEEVRKEILYKVDIFSTSGDVFKNGVIESDLKAIVVQGKRNITETLPETSIVWTKINNDGTTVNGWKKTGKEISITDKDVKVKQIFNCSVIVEKAAVAQDNITIVDLNDIDGIESSLENSLPSAQIYSPSTKKTLPDWSVTNQVLKVKVMRNGKDITKDTDLKWFFNNSPLVADNRFEFISKNELKIKANIMSLESPASFIRCNSKIYDEEIGMDLEDFVIFNMSLTSDGKEGEDGDDAVTHWITSSTDTILVNMMEEKTPLSMTFRGQSKRGEEEAKDFMGYFVIQTSTDGVDYKTTYTSKNPESVYSLQTPRNTEIKFLKAKMFQDIKQLIPVGEITIPYIKDIVDLDVGRRNYAQQTAFLEENNTMWYMTSDPNVRDPDYDYSLDNGEISLSGGSVNWWKQWQIASNRGATALHLLEPNETYTVSYEYWIKEGTVGSINALYRRNFSNGTSADYLGNPMSVNNLEKEKWIETSYTQNVGEINNNFDEVNFSRLMMVGTVEGQVKFRKVRIYKGNVKGDWSEAPEDVAEQALNSGDGINIVLDSKYRENEDATEQGSVDPNARILYKLSSPIEIGQKYTFSMTYDIVPDEDVSLPEAIDILVSSSPYSTNSYPYKYELNEVGLGTVKWTFIATEPTEAIEIFLGEAGKTFSDKCHFIYTFVKLEKGSTATNWTQNPMDIESSIEDIIANQEPGIIWENIATYPEFVSLFNTKASNEDIHELGKGQEEIQNQILENQEYVSAVEAGLAESVNVLTKQIEETSSDLQMKFGLSKGVNLMRNSTGWFGTDFFTVEGALSDIGNIELEEFGLGHAFYSPLGMSTVAYQTVSVLPETDYSLTAWIKKPNKTTNSVPAFLKLENGGMVTNLGPAETALQPKFGLYTHKFTTDADVTELKLTLFCSSEAEVYWSGAMLNEGDIPLQWTSHSEEIANTTMQFNINGLKVIGADSSYTIMSPREFSGYANVLDDITNEMEMERVFSVNGETTEVNKLEAKKTIAIGNLTMSSINSSGYNGMAFVKTERLSIGNRNYAQQTAFLPPNTNLWIDSNGDGATGIFREYKDGELWITGTNTVWKQTQLGTHHVGNEAVALNELRWGREFTLSYEVFVVAGTVGTVSMQLREGGATNYISSIDDSASLPKGVWKKRVVVGSLPKAKDNLSYMRLMLTASTNGTVAFRKVKLEEGNVATNWIEAIEDGE